VPPATDERRLRPLTAASRVDLHERDRFDFVVTGDSRPILPRHGYPKVTHRLFAELRLLRPALVLYTGDIVWGYGAGRQELLNDYDRFRSLAESVGVPLYNVPGNHEMLTDRMAIALLEELGHDLYGSFDVGSCHFVALNTDEYWLEGRVTGRQLDWLRADLEASREAAHIFVFMHRPLFSWFQGDFNPDDAGVLQELFRSYPVRAVFAAHDHFHHVEEHDGVRYMTVAGAGSPLYAQPQKGGFAHYVFVSVTPEGIDYNVIEPGHLDVDLVAGNDGIEPMTVARVANTTDRDLLVRNLELRVPRLESAEDYGLSVDYLDWSRARQELPARLRAVSDLHDGSVSLSLEVPVPSGTVFRVRAEARLPDGRPGIQRALVVNADDFGRSEPITSGILRAHREGIVTSTSLMVRWSSAEEAARLAAAEPGLSVGLHLDFGEWAFRDGEWGAVYEVVPLDGEGRVGDEARSQLERFRALTGRDPTHLDSHQHVHVQDEHAGAVARRLAEELGVPLRHNTPGVHYCGDFYGRTREGESNHEAISVDHLLRLIRGLPPGTTELACHPADADEDPLYDEERVMELRVLCDPRVREALVEEGIETRSFAELRT
jgi:predicted glycoside hydrolase/deacetylase ChbG (UPF0249 family)/3',5'-cyclic AMP phosphodiesterase CpdA